MAGLGDDIMAFTRNAVGAIPGGNNAAAAIGAGVRNLGAAVAPGSISPTTYGQQLQNVNAAQQQAQQQAPISSALGGAAGAVDSGVLEGGIGGKVATAFAASAAPGAALVGRMLNVAQSLGARPILGGAAAGAIGGAVDTGLRMPFGQTSASDILPSMVLGAVGGAAVGKAADLVATKLAPLSDRGWQLLAKHINKTAATGGFDSMAADSAARTMLRDWHVDPQDLATNAAKAAAANGGKPVPLAAVLTQSAQAHLAKAAGTSPELGNPLAAAQSNLEASGPSIVPAQINAAVAGVPHTNSPTGYSGVQNIAALEGARDANMSAAMGPLRQTPVVVTAQDAQSLDDAYTAVRGKLENMPAATETAGVLARVRQAAQDVADPNGPGMATMSLDDIEKLRHAVGQATPLPANNSLAYSSGRALQRDIAGIGTRQVQGYADALTQYGRHSAYIDGFQDGLPGKAIEQIPGAAAQLRQASGPAYAEGHASGLVSGLADKAAASPSGTQSVLNTLSQDNAIGASLRNAYGPQAQGTLASLGRTLGGANQAMSAVAPSGPVSAPTSAVGQNLAHAAVGITTGHHYAVWHNLAGTIMSLFHSHGMSPAAGGVAAKMLTSTDPAVQQQAVNFLRGLKIGDAEINKMVGLAAAAGGARFQDAVQGR